MFRKSKFIFTGVCLVLGSMALAGSKPIYTEKTYSLIGIYEARGACRWDGEIEVVGRTEGLKMLVNGGYFKTELDSDRKILKFDLENALNTECEELGCTNIDYAKGVIYPKKIKRKWVPQIKLHLDLGLEILCDTGEGYTEVCELAEGSETCTFVKVN